MKYSIGIDIGGTRIKGVVLNEAGEIIGDSMGRTSTTGNGEWKKDILQTVEDFRADLPHSVYSIGISAPGLPNDDHTAIAFMPGRLHGLEGFNWSEYLGQETLVINDAIAALLAEHYSGAAQNKQNVVMVTLGTGVGGAILINGVPYMGSFNKAGHIGHMVINDSEDAGITGMPGSLEESIGDASLPRRSEGLFHSTKDLVNAYRNNDLNAKNIWLKSIEKLAIGLSSITNILSPELIVIGGGIAESKEDLLEPLQHYMKKYEWVPGGKGVEVRPAQHGSLAGAIGVANYALKQQQLKT